MNKNPNYGQEVVNFFFFRLTKQTDKIFTVRLEGLFLDKK